MKIRLFLITAALLSNTAFSQPASRAEMNYSASNSAVKNFRKPIQSITKSQAKAARMFLVVENFERIDANNDGIVTRSELRAYALATRPRVPMT